MGINRQPNRNGNNMNMLVTNAIALLWNLLSDDFKRPDSVTKSAIKSISNSLAKISNSGIKTSKYDCFISYSTEDKKAVALPLANSLRNHGLKVWFDEFELHIGDSIRRKIDEGLANSLFGIVILSKSFLSKNWTQYELDGLVVREMSVGNKVILPIWHDVTREQVEAYSPSLSCKVALNTGLIDIVKMATEIANVVEERKKALK